jgi:hypothetical protein
LKLEPRRRDDALEAEPGRQEDENYGAHTSLP